MKTLRTFFGSIAFCMAFAILLAFVFAPLVDWAIDATLAFLSWEWWPVITFCAAVVAVAILTIRKLKL